MKRLIFSFVFLLSYPVAYCQPGSAKLSLPLTGNKIVYRQMVNPNTSVSKEKLWDNAQEWYKKNYQSADNTLTIDNAEDGKLSGTGIIHTGDKERETYPGDLYFTIDIIVAKGRYEYIVYDIYGFDKDGKFYYSDMYNEHNYPQAKPRWKATYRRIMLEHMNRNIGALVAKLRIDMNNN